MLSDEELLKIAEVVAELARLRGRDFDQIAVASRFGRAAMASPAFRAKIIEVHRRVEARRATKEPRHLLAPLAPLFRDLEREAETVLNRGERGAPSI